MAIVDLEKAFNSINQTGLFKAQKSLEETGIDFKDIRILNNSLEDKVITQVDHFKYLGSIITEDGKSTKEIRNRKGQAKTYSLKRRNY